MRASKIRTFTKTLVYRYRYRLCKRTLRPVRDEKTSPLYHMRLLILRLQEN